MTDREVMQQALEALREFGYHGSSPRWERTANALKTELAQPEPVQLRQLREENERLKKEIANQDAMLERQTARIVDLQTRIENFDGEDR